MTASLVDSPDTQMSDPGLEEGKVAHVIPKESHLRGYVLGETVEALCGEKFIPTRDPSKFPMCEGCKIAIQLMISE
jgi:hypothetical protein